MPSVKTLNEIMPLLSLLIALVAVFLGPFLSAWVARRQIVVPIRQQWIDELRNLVTEFLSTSQMLIVSEEANGILNNEDLDKDTYKKMLFIERKLTLMLNPNEDLHNELMEHVRKLMEQIEHGVPNLLEFGPLVRIITETAQKILKKEWVRVKKWKI